MTDERISERSLALIKEFNAYYSQQLGELIKAGIRRKREKEAQSICREEAKECLTISN
ncbi:MAG: hypothetical protein LUH03_03735 [Oscillospiraceae bacterium]|nr:hypothetical protein [Oscillospiraceae bacterium]